MKQKGQIVLPEKQTCPRRLWIAPKHNRIDVRKRTQNANIPHPFRVKEDEADIHKCERGQKSTDDKKSLRCEPFVSCFVFCLKLTAWVCTCYPIYTIKWEETSDWLTWFAYSFIWYGTVKCCLFEVHKLQKSELNKLLQLCFDSTHVAIGRLPYKLLYSLFPSSLRQTSPKCCPVTTRCI